MRKILFKEAVSGLSVRCSLLEEVAPLSVEFVWQLAQLRQSFEAIHAIWTGPELSCPLPASMLPVAMAKDVVPSENATSFPEAGDIVLASLPAHAVKGMPPGNFFDLGLFYGGGGRLMMPFGWIKANVCARVVDEDFLSFQEHMGIIRRNGVCQLFVEPL